MNRIQLACYCLIASAFILTALVVVHADSLAENRAYAEMVVNKSDYTVLTAELNETEEIVYFLDNRSERLLVYQLDRNKQIVELLATYDVNDIIGKALKRVR